MGEKLADAFSSSLLGGEFADVEWEKFQSSVLIEVKRGEDVFTSSAVVIARNALLTCAHSVDQIEGGRVFWDAQYRPHSKKFVKFKRVVVHPGYDPRKSNYENDLAVVILKNNLPSRTRPTKIWDHPELLSEGAQAHRIGFGARSGANIRTWTNPEIMRYEKSSKSFVLRDCHGRIGDSGGPLFIKDGAAYKLFALHSTKEGEDTSYTVSVADHMPWIFSNLEVKLIGP